MIVVSRPIPLLREDNVVHYTEPRQKPEAVCSLPFHAARKSYRLPRCYGGPRALDRVQIQGLVPGGPAFPPSGASAFQRSRIAALLKTAALDV